jgi:hypothetical protein
VAKRLLRKTHLAGWRKKGNGESFSPLRSVRDLAAGASDAKVVTRPLDFECNLRGNVIWIAYTGRIVSQHIRRTG